MTNPAEIDDSRRGFFAIAALPLLVFGFGSRAGAAEAPCYDVKTLTGGQQNQRKNVKFRPSTDPMKQCSGCMYFSGSPTGCGKCQILLNGPVSSKDVCDSWTKKAA